MYSVILSAEAEDIYASADQALAKKIARCFEQLEQNPRFHPNIKPLKGDLAGYYRYRIGDYRVIYQIDDDTDQVIVNTIAHRREAYE
ncbi:MAG: type II toxin-antitoxin system RelE/ParE family toxin [Iphinoe sp. HA4291-MV1]|jgi:mRNA interferase RelE/StbE|nr:type II toxin-antitoxin system RelE/ParE family toxin [Iphinoe sp. HA4291-MV1]